MPTATAGWRAGGWERGEDKCFALPVPKHSHTHSTHTQHTRTHHHQRLAGQVGGGRARGRVQRDWHSGGAGLCGRASVCGGAAGLSGAGLSKLGASREARSGGREEERGRGQGREGRLFFFLPDLKTKITDRSFFFTGPTESQQGGRPAVTTITPETPPAPLSTARTATSTAGTCR